VARLRDRTAPARGDAPERAARPARRGGAASATPDGSADPGRWRSDPGQIENVAVLDLTSVRDPDDLAGITSIANVAVVLVPESLAGALTRIPTRNVASIVPIPDGAEVRLHTGAVVLGGDALADPAGEDVVLIVTGTLALSSPVQSGHLPQGHRHRHGARPLRQRGRARCRADAGHRLGAVLPARRGQRFRTMSGQTELSGESLANTGGDPADLLFLIGQTTITSPIEEVGYQHVVAPASCSRRARAKRCSLRC
jgi:hypothetical protein